MLETLDTVEIAGRTWTIKLQAETPVCSESGKRCVVLIDHDEGALRLCSRTSPERIAGAVARAVTTLWQQAIADAQPEALAPSIAARLN